MTPADPLDPVGGRVESMGHWAAEYAVACLNGKWVHRQVALVEHQGERVLIVTDDPRNPRA